MSRIAQFWARFPEAIRHGWYLAQEYPDSLEFGHYYFVYPPKHFACRDWCNLGNELVIRLGGMEIQVPASFWDDTVMRTGARKSQ